MKIPDDAARFSFEYDAPKAGPADTPDTLSDNTPDYTHRLQRGGERRSDFINCPDLEEVSPTAACAEREPGAIGVFLPCTHSFRQDDQVLRPGDAVG